VEDVVVRCGRRFRPLRATRFWASEGRERGETLSSWQDDDEEEKDDDLCVLVVDVGLVVCVLEGSKEEEEGGMPACHR
jgi:hypothetical protein